MVDVDHLIDISGHNNVRDWRQVAGNGIVGASVKVSQANNFLNRLRAGQVTGARAAGVVPGGYHFGDHRYDARAQAKYFVQHAAALRLFDAGCLAPMYDVENWQQSDGMWVQWQSRQQISDHIGIWLDVLAEETDADRALVYGSRSWWGSLLVPDDWRHGIEVLNWLALYNGQPGQLRDWSDPRDALHQHTSDGIVPGIDGRVDKNVTLRGRRLPGLLIGGDDMPTAKEVVDELLARVVPFHADPANVGGPVWMHVSGANWAAQRSEQMLLEQRAVLAAVLAAQEDDVTDVDVLARLEQAMGVEVDRLRAELVAAREADRAAMVEAVRDTVPAELADQVVTRLGERLADRPFLSRRTRDVPDSSLT